MKTISFVIPVYNESKRLSKTFEALKKLKLSSSLLLESIIFVDDGSTDNSSLLIKKESQKLKEILKTDVKLISYSENKGKGYAVKKGLLSSVSDYTLFFDTDISTPLYEIEKFVPYINGGIDFLVGTRRNGKSTVIVHQNFIREFLGRGFTLITRMFLGIDANDFTCGFKALSQRAISVLSPQLKIDSWAFDAELLFLANKEKLSIKQIPVYWYNDPNSKVKLYKAIPTTIRDLFTIKWEYDLKPNISYFSKSESSPISKSV